MDGSLFRSLDALSGVDTSDLTEREQHLIGLAVTVTRGCIQCTGGRIQEAVEAGISYQTVIQAIDLSAAVNAGVTVTTALEGAERFRDGIVATCGEACFIGTIPGTDRAS